MFSTNKNFYLTESYKKNKSRRYNYSMRMAHYIREAIGKEFTVVHTENASFEPKTKERDIIQKMMVDKLNNK